MNPWEEILKKAVGSAILVELPAFESHEDEILAAAAKAEITVYNVAEKYIDAQLAAAQLPPVLGFFRAQLISAANQQIANLRSGTVNSDNEILFKLLVAWAKQEATNLGA